MELTRERIHWLLGNAEVVTCEVPCGSPEAPHCLCDAELDEIERLTLRGLEAKPEAIVKAALEAAEDVCDRHGSARGRIRALDTPEGREKILAQEKK